MRLVSSHIEVLRMAKLYSTGRPSSLHPPALPSPFLLCLPCSPDTALPPLSPKLLRPLHPHPHPHLSLQPFPVTQAIGHHHTDPIPQTQSHKPTPRLPSPFSSPPPFPLLTPHHPPVFPLGAHFPLPTSHFHTHPPAPPRQPPPTPIIDSPSALSSPPLQNHRRMDFFVAHLCGLGWSGW